MTKTTLRYGVDSSLSLELPSDILLASCNAPRGEPIADIFKAVDSALAAPVDYPPLDRAVVPGDRVVLALERGVPQSATIVAAVVDSLLKAQVAPDAITIIRSPEDVADQVVSPLAEVPAGVRDQIVTKVHDAADRRDLSYLAASTEGKPIYMSRDICEADLVVPIGCLRLEESLGYHGISGGVYPAFSDDKSQSRYRSPSAVDSATQRKRLRKEADEVRWLLGVMFTVQVVPGAGDEVLHVLAGEVDAVVRRGKQLCADAWSYSVPRRASLVVASVAGDASQQTWENLGRALASASRAVTDEGAIALCTELSTEPGPALQQIAGADDPQSVLRQIVKEKPSDALPASQLLHALERGKVYLLSRLRDELVEELGVAPVSSSEQIARLAARHESCIVLANAQYAVATPESDGAESE